MSALPKFDDEALAARLEALRLSRASSLTEGLREHPEDAVLVEALVRGEIDEDEFMRRLLSIVPKPTVKLRHVA